MTIQDIHELSERGRALTASTSALLDSAEDDRLGVLARALVRSAPDEPLRLVVTGEYNSGKSTILRALTGRQDIHVDSDVATSEVTAYEWGQVLLVDTPGVKAGVREEHDQLAEQALRDADLVLFVITVDLFDDVTAAHLRHVADDLGKRRQLVVAVNKSATMKAPDGVRQRAVRDVIGTVGGEVPVVECDALRHLRARDRVHSGQAEPTGTLPGNMDGLGAALTRLAAGRGQQGRLRKPFDAVAAAVADAEPFFGEDPSEQALRQLCTRRRQVIVRSRTRLGQALADLYRESQEQVARAGRAVIDNVDPDTGALPPETVATFDQEYRQVAERLAAKIDAAILAEADQLDADLADLAHGPQIRTLVEQGLVILDDVDQSRVTRGPAAAGGSPEWAPAAALVQAWAKAALKDVAAQGARPGAPMHAAVKHVGHALGHKFKPYGIIKVAKIGVVAVNVGLFVFDAYMQYRQIDAKEKAEGRAIADMSAKVRITAESLTEQADEVARPIIEHAYNELLEDVARSEGQINATAQRRDQLHAALLAARVDARSALATLDAMTADPEPASEDRD